MTSEVLPVEGSQKIRPTWIRPGLVLCDWCFMTEDFDYANEHWWWASPGDTWLCPDCEHDRESTALGGSQAKGSE